MLQKLVVQMINYLKYFIVILISIYNFIVKMIKCWLLNKFNILKFYKLYV